MPPPLGLAHSSSDPALKRKCSTRSLVRQPRVDSSSREESPEPSCVLRVTTPSFKGSDASLHLLDNHSSVQSASPVGDLIPVDRGRPGVLRSAVRMMSVKNKGSLSSLQSDGRNKHILLHNVGRTIQRTGSQLRKTRLFHLFYLLVLPFYTLIGALIFQTLDGEHDDRLVQEYKNRCKGDRDIQLAALKELCVQGEDCFAVMAKYVEQVEQCYREWHAHNRTVTHSMADFTNALVYAFSVYTTIGYGNMAADTVRCRIATILYGAFGIPLFFAFVKEEGNLCRTLFISVYNRVRKARKNCRFQYTEHEREVSDPTSSEKPSPVPPYHNGQIQNCLSIPLSPHMPLTPQQSPIPTPTSEDGEAPTEREVSKFTRFQRKQSSGSLFGSKAWLDEQRRVFLAGVIVFVLYILTASAFFSLTTEFDYFTSVYFLFNSVALIGFGDVFPQDPRTILIHAVFMVLGVVLFSMCYFILQEEIREKAFEASRKARISISKYSHTIVQHARSPWSRRNSPLYDGANPPDSSAFERLKKRRQSAPAVAITAPTGKTRFRDI